MSSENQVSSYDIRILPPQSGSTNRTPPPPPSYTRAPNVPTGLAKSKMYLCKIGVREGKW